MALSFEAEAERIRNPDPPEIATRKRVSEDAPPPELLKRLASGDKNMTVADMDGAPPELHAALGDLSVADAMKPKQPKPGEGGDGEKTGDEGPAVKASELNLPDGESTVSNSEDTTTPETRKKGAGPDEASAGGSQENEAANADKQKADAEDKQSDPDSKSETGGSEGPGDTGGPSVEDPKAKGAIPDPKHPEGGGGGGAASGAGGGAAGGGSVATQFLNAMGPHKSDKAEASESLLTSAWHFASTPLGPLIGYDSRRGGFQPENLWGIGSSIEGVFNAAAKDRGDGALATVIKGLDMVRAAAEGIATVSGFIGTTCGILSLIGLIPPLAPIGAALAGVAGIMTSIAFWSSVVALASSLIVSVLSAVQLVQAVKDGAPNVRELYATYQEDVGGLLANGISVGTLAITRAFGKTFRNKPHRLGQGMKTLGATAKAQSGRTARGQLVRSINKMGGSASMTTKGSTVAALRTQLRGHVRQGMKLEARRFAVTRIDSAIQSYGKRQFTEGAKHDAGRTRGGVARGGASKAEFTAEGGMAARALESHVPQIGADAGPSSGVMPTAERSPVELDDIAARREEIAGARRHVSDEKSEGETAIEVGKELEANAAEREADAQRIDKQVAGDTPNIDKFETDADSGAQEAKKGQQEAAKLGGETDSLKGEAEAKQADVGNVRMPPKPKPKGLWGKIKAFFQEKVFGLARRALDKVRQFMTDMILDIVASCMGVDDIDAELKAVQEEMEESKLAAQETKATTEDVSSDATKIHEQATEADASAKEAQEQGEDAVGKADDFEAQLKAQDDELRAEEEAVKAANEAFEGQEGPGLDHRASSGLVINAKRIADSKAAAQSLSGGLTSIDQEASLQFERAKSILVSDAKVLGFPVSVVEEGAFGQIGGEFDGLILRNDHRRGQIAQLEAKLSGQAGKPFVEAEAELNSVSQELAILASEADADFDTFLENLTQAVQATGKALEQGARKRHHGPRMGPQDG